MRWRSARKKSGGAAGDEGGPVEGGEGAAKEVTPRLITRETKSETAVFFSVAAA
jgi:hypothetical protein